MLREAEFKIQGLRCASCVSRVEKTLSDLPGMQKAEVNLANEKARAKWDPALLEVSTITQAVQKIGYGAELSQSSYKEEDEKKHKELKLEFFHVVASLLLSFPLILPMLLEPLGFHLMLSPLVQLILATPVQFYFGFPFLKGAYKAVLSKTGTMDLLVSLGTGAAYLLSCYLMWKNNTTHLYFESAAVVISLVRLGKYLEARAKGETTKALRELEELMPTKARLIKNGVETLVDLSDLRLGDKVLIKPGEKIPVDALILNGTASVDEALISGESLPIEKVPGQKVIAASINLDGALEVQVTALGSETTLARLIRLVESAQSAKAPIQRLVDKISAVFVPIVLLISVLTFVGWYLYGAGLEPSLLNAVAVLIIACPCALGLATPAAIMVGTGVAAEKGILIRDAEALETAHSVTTVAFDKTGTLTKGHPELVAFKSFEASEAEFLRILGHLQKKSEHPLSKAFVKVVLEKAIQLESQVEFFKVIAGKGFQAKFEGEEYFVGNHTLMKQESVSLDMALEEIRKYEISGSSVSYLARKRDQKLLGYMCFSDVLKPTSFETIKELKSLGIRTLLISGDNEGAASFAAKELGIDEYYANVLPADKAGKLKSYVDKGEIVAMVGDGINDAPALAAASIGMAMSTGTDIAMNTAGITLMRGDPILIPLSIELSRKTYSKIKQNLFWAFIYNIIGIPLAAFGYLNPMIAGAAMALSSVSVMTNALLLRKEA